MIPILDQVMDARDITGTLFRINKQGGFGSATADQLVNLGFAAFGAIPEVGSAFKTVFKPLWKERRAAKGAVHSGLNAIEGLLGLRKGGAIRWVREQLLGKWVARTNQAIQQVDLALASCIELTEFVATASGWKDWLIPDPVQELARKLLPGLRSLQGKIRAPLQRASNEIRALLKDLLGEQVAAVVMAVGTQAAAGSAVPGSRPRTGNNMADTKPRGRVTERQPPRKVQDGNIADAHKGRGAVHGAMQLTRKAFKDLANQEKGLIGEHMVDYHELKRLGGSWPHDKPAGSFSPNDVRKLNVDKRPVNLSLIDLPKVNHACIDAVWQHGSRYTVTEAKSRESVFALEATAATYGNATSKGLSKDLQSLYFLLHDSSDKRGAATPMVQMSVAWVKSRAGGEGLPDAARAALRNPQNRRVVLVTFESAGAVDHVQALTDIHMGKVASEVHRHIEHGVTKVWESADIDKVVAARERAYEAKRQGNSRSPADEAEPAKPARPARRSHKGK